MRKLLNWKHHITATNETVRLILRQLDPASVSSRRRHRLQRRTYVSRGPNDTWHMDGYDKLAPYGFCIHGFVIVIYSSAFLGRLYDEFLA